MICVQCLTVSCLIYFATCGFSSADKGVVANTLNGDMLVKMGRRIKHPLLTLIGMAIRKLHQCSEWTQWSECQAKHLTYFSSRNRTRVCTKVDDMSESFTTEDDTGVCEGKCPVSYNLTGNSFCWKLHNLKMNWDDAEKVCQSEGGNLLYVDSEGKFNHLNETLKDFNGDIWIDGRRKDNISLWQNVNGVTLTKFFWSSNEPNNRPDELCIARSHNSREWHDAPCSDHYHPLCEIVD